MELTKEERNLIKTYTKTNYVNVNQLLLSDAEIDVALLEQGKTLDYSKEKIQDNIEILKSVYKILLRNFASSDKKEWSFYKNVSNSEIEKLKMNNKIDNFMFAYLSENEARKQIENSSNKQFLLKIDGKGNVPYLQLDKVLKKNESGVIISPFTQISMIDEMTIDGEKVYNISIETQEFETMSDTKRKELYDYILENCGQINEKLVECVELDRENTIHYENIRKLEQLLAKHNFTMEQENYESDTTETEKQADLDDIARINNELEVLKGNVTNVFQERQENTILVTNWKKDLSEYIMAECGKIYQDEIFEKTEHEKVLEEKKINEEKIEKILNDKKAEEKLKIEQIQKETNEKSEKQLKNVDEKIENTSSSNSEIEEVQKECQENIEMVKTLLNNIKTLISKQQNYARIADEIDSHYKALNNAFEMKNYAEELEVLVESIFNKVNLFTENDLDKVKKISKTNLQISTLMNYLNNAKSAVSKKISRFDEINIIEENELKKEIAETIKNIRCEAELKKLRDDVDIIEYKSKFKRFIGRFTGRNKLDEAMLEQIHIREKAIRKTFKSKMPLAYNYSIHELIAEIEMFIKENEDDELVIEDVGLLRRIENVLKRNFVIIDSKVVSIIDRKTGKNLPFSSEKISKRELIEIDTYRFLNKYGYDKALPKEEPEYQDTMASEIKRIIDYIKSSGVI